MFFISIFIFYILSKTASPDCHLKQNQFSWKIFLSLPNKDRSSKTRTKHQCVQIFPQNRFYIIFFRVYYMHDCPVSRYTVQDKPLFVVTTIQNRISQTVCTSIEHTIELDISMKNTKIFSCGMETSLR